MTKDEYEEEKKFVMSELVCPYLKSKGNQSSYINELIELFANDREVMLECLKYHQGCTEFASKELYSDKDFVSMVVGSQGNYLQFASAQLKDDIEIVLKACDSHMQGLKYASVRIQSSPILVAKTCIDGFNSLSYMDKSISNSKEKFLSLLEAIMQNKQNYPSDEKSRMAKMVVFYASDDIKALVANKDPVNVLKKSIYSDYLASQLKPKCAVNEKSVKIKL